MASCVNFINNDVNILHRISKIKCIVVIDLQFFTRSCSGSRGPEWCLCEKNYEAFWYLILEWSYVQIKSCLYH